MEKSDVNCEINNEEFSKKCTVSKECGNYSKEDILVKDFDNRLTLKPNGLINGLKNTDSYNNDHNVDIKDNSLVNCDENDVNTSTNSQIEQESVTTEESLPKIEYVQYESELQMPMIMKIIQKDLSEPYSIYTYRYFIHNWPKLCFLVGIILNSLR